MPASLASPAREFRVYLGTTRVSCALSSYWAAVLWARDFADGIAGKPLRAPLVIVQEA